MKMNRCPSQRGMLSIGRRPFLKFALRRDIQGHGLRNKNVLAATTSTGTSQADAWHLIVDNGLSSDGDSSRQNQPDQTPMPLPEPPLTGAFLDVIPYLLR